MWSTLKSSQLDLSGFTPTAINYSEVADQHRCVLCQDYKEIDTFAERCSLDKLWKSKENRSTKDSQNTLIDHDPSKVFDASVFLGTLDRLETSGNRILTQKNLNNSQNLNVKSRFFDLTTCPIKNDDDLIAITQAYPQRYEELEKKWRDLEKVNEKGVKEAKEKFDTFCEEHLRALQTYSYLQVDGLEPVKLLAVHLWLGFLKARKRLSNPDNAQKDNVAKARLIFSWLAYSVKYDQDLAKDEDRVRGWRNLGDVLSNGKEICRGYADMFVTMFNALTESTEPQAERIIGYAREVGGGIQLSQDEETTDRCHAWSAFPLHQKATPGDYKVIDVTWATTGAGSALDNTWWSTTNRAFRWTHVPLEDSQQFYPIPDSLGFKVLWQHSQPLFPRQGRSFLSRIDLDSLCPRNLKATATRDGQYIEVAFENACEHQKGYAPDFYLGVVAKQTDDASKTTPNFEKCIDTQKFSMVMSPVHQTGYFWVAAILKDKVPQLAHLAILARVEETPKKLVHKPVILWNWGW